MTGAGGVPARRPDREPVQKGLRGAQVEPVQTRMALGRAGNPQRVQAAAARLRSAPPRMRLVTHREVTAADSERVLASFAGLR